VQRKILIEPSCNFYIYLLIPWKRLSRTVGIYIAGQEITLFVQGTVRLSPC